MSELSPEAEQSELAYQMVMLEAEIGRQFTRSETYPEHRFECTERLKVLYKELNQVTGKLIGLNILCV